MLAHGLKSSHFDPCTKTLYKTFEAVLWQQLTTYVITFQRTVMISKSWLLFFSIIHTIHSTSCDNVKELMTLHKLQWFCIVANNSIQMFWLPPGLLLANLTKISRIWQFIHVRERLKLPDALNQSIKKFYSTVVSNGKMWG